MITVSNDYRTATQQPAKTWHAYLRDQELYPDEITDADDLKTLKISAKSSLLRTVMRQVDAVFFGSHDYLEQYVNVGIGIVKADTTTEYIDYGSFKIIKQEFDRGVDGVMVKGYDKMYEAHQLYDLDPIYELTFPATMLEMLEAICTRLGWTLATGSDSFPNDDLSMPEDPVSTLGLTFRQVLDMIAEASGSIIYFNTDDELVVRQVAHDTPLETLDEDKLMTLEVEGLYGEINSVVLSRTPQEDNILEKDQTSIDNNGLTEIKIENNLLVDHDRETYVQPIFDELFGLELYPFEAETVGFGYFEVGDRITVTDPTEVARETVVFGFELDMTGGLQEKLFADAPDKTTTNYKLAGIIGQAIKSTEIKVDKINGTITLITQDINNQLSQIIISIGEISTTVQQQSEQLESLETELEQTAEALELLIQSSGGTNLLKNSVGLKGTITEWQTLDENGDPVDADNDGVVDQGLDVRNNTESGSAIEISEQFIEQTFPTIQGETYTVYLRYKSDLAVDLVISDIGTEVLPAAADWTVFKYQFIAPTTSTTVRFTNVPYAGSDATLSDMVVNLGDANKWVQAPNEVYGSTFRFDKDGLTIVSLTDTFKTVIDNTQIAVYDTAGGGEREVMAVSKERATLTRATIQDDLIMQRSDNPLPNGKFIPIDTGIMLVINEE